MTTAIQKQFAKMGADANVSIGGVRGVRVNVRGSTFVIDAAKDSKVLVVDLDPNLRHLLLHVEESGDKHKFLCGHDERHWFVAAVPGNGVSSIQKAMTALKPAAVRDEEVRRGVRLKKKNKRRNEAFLRQGEWFFVADPNFQPSKNAVILRNEPIRRGRGKPHMCEYLHRSGGESVWFHTRLAPNGVNEEEYRSLRAKDNGGWRPMVRNARVVVKGKISHSDHATIHLDGWHTVSMNEEHRAPSSQFVAFLD